MANLAGYIVSIAILWIALRTLLGKGAWENVLKGLFIIIALILLIGMAIEKSAEADALMILLCWLLLSVPSYLYLRHRRRGNRGRDSFSLSGSERQAVMPPGPENNDNGDQ